MSFKRLKQIQAELDEGNSGRVIVASDDYDTWGSGGQTGRPLSQPKARNHPEAEGDGWGSGGPTRQQPQDRGQLPGAGSFGTSDGWSSGGAIVPSDRRARTGRRPLGEQDERARDPQGRFAGAAAAVRGKRYEDAHRELTKQGFRVSEPPTGDGRTWAEHTYEHPDGTKLGLRYERQPAPRGTIRHKVTVTNLTAAASEASPRSDHHRDQSGRWVSQGGGHTGEPRGMEPIEVEDDDEEEELDEDDLDEEEEEEDEALDDDEDDDEDDEDIDDPSEEPEDEPFEDLDPVRLEFWKRRNDPHKVAEDIDQDLDPVRHAYWKGRDVHPNQHKVAEADLDDELIAIEAYQELPPWSPVPVWPARQFQRDNPAAAIEVVLPTVYEEDRTSKIKDLATTNALGVISHRRMSDQSAKELGFEDYNYDDEQKQIGEEKQELPPEEFGAASQLVMGGKGAGRGGGIVIGGTPSGLASERSRDDGEPKRLDLSGPAQAAFRRDMRQAQAAEAAQKALRAVSVRLRSLREAIERRPAAPANPPVTVENVTKTELDPDTVRQFQHLSEAVAALGETVASLRSAPTEISEAADVIREATKAMKESLRVAPTEMARATAQVIHQLTEAVRGLAKTRPDVHIDVQPPTVNIEPAPAPHVQVDVVPPAPRMTRIVKRIVRDPETGLATHLIEEHTPEGGTE